MLPRSFAMEDSSLPITAEDKSVRAALRWLPPLWMQTDNHQDNSMRRTTCAGTKERIALHRGRQG